MPQITVAVVAEALKDGVIPMGAFVSPGRRRARRAAGAHVVMIGSLLAGSEDAPGEVELRTRAQLQGLPAWASGRHVAQPGLHDRYFQDIASHRKLVPEGGLRAAFPTRGRCLRLGTSWMGGLRSSMGYTGCEDIGQMRTKPQFVKITASGMSESHVHDVSITKEAPNYRMS
ncbi:MAG: IMP dehydrogenase [Gammaproteobacteria bacterium]